MLRQMEKRKAPGFVTQTFAGVLIALVVLVVVGTVLFALGLGR